MTIFCWNCRGFGEADDPTIPYLHRCVLKFHPLILFLQETHTSVDVAYMKTSHLGFPNYFGVDSTGRSGGLLLYWDSSVDIQILCSNPHFIFCKLGLKLPQGVYNDMYSMFIYGESTFQYRSNLWDQISNVVLGCTSFLVIGDFNQVELHTDKLGGSRSIRGQVDFTTWKLQNNLVDIPFFGPRFTWMNGQLGENCIMERLDRAYATQDWFDVFPHTSLLNLPILISDHSPIILHLFHAKNTTRRPYRIDNWCLHLTEVINLVTLAFQTPFLGSLPYILSRKLANVPFAILKWVLQHRITYGIDWSSIERDLELSATDISDLASADDFQLLRSNRLQLISKQHGYWTQRSLLCVPAHSSAALSFASTESFLSALDLPSLSSTDCSVLSAPFSDNDVLQALRTMDGSKSPGPDGVMLKEWNNTHIVLIPKIDHPELITHYRPISLCNVIYRIVSKCLANRLKLVIPSVISDSQQAFVLGRLMSDGCLVAHEVLHYINKTRKGTNCYAALKLDMSKAFDRVSWHFLMAVMRHMGFPTHWRNIIWECISTVSYRILINGTPSDALHPTSGLRQGDPISPYLFIICMEVLSRQLAKAERMKDFTGIKISRYAPTLSHLLFSDDALLCYFRTHLTSILKMPTVSCFGDYLGVPIDIPRKKSEPFLPLIDKITTRIASWSALHLSQSSKLVIISSILLASLNHIFSCVPIPHGVRRKIDALIAAFWWRSDWKKNTIHWLRRDILQTPKEFGGLGIKDTFLFSQSLLLKKFWRITSQPTSLLAKFWKAKYQKDLPIPKSRSLVSNVSYAWSGLCRTVNLTKDAVCWKIGSGNLINIWSDRWVNGELPSTVTPSPTPPPSLSSFVLPSGDWNPTMLFRYFSTQTAKEIIVMEPPVPDIDDFIYWKFTEDGAYSVKSGYFFLWPHTSSASFARSSATRFPWHIIWRNNLSRKLSLFLWRMAHNILPRNVTLLSRGLNIAQDCHFCHYSHDSMDHLFRSCSITQHLWKSSWLGINSMTNPLTSFITWIADILSYLSRRSYSQSMDYSLIYFCSLLRATWIPRNLVVFQNHPVDPEFVYRLTDELVSSCANLQLARSSFKTPVVCFPPINVTSTSSYQAGGCWIAVSTQRDHASPFFHLHLL
ncbi:uncharacterized protein LOC141649061 [Silene latifolia]|uniref:uncharacterized protein LOC141649061 n=1 Tax=Silene latifolia TaxID=37657 RepID=UPI003D781D68